MSAPQVVRTTVLVADDDALVRGVLRMALARLGHEVHEACLVKAKEPAGQATGREFGAEQL